MTLEILRNISGIAAKAHNLAERIRAIPNTDPVSNRDRERRFPKVAPIGLRSIRLRRNKKDHHGGVISAPHFNIRG